MQNRSESKNESSPEHRSGAVALLGATNAGKSSILNRILEKKITSAVSSKPQTTRNRILGVKHRSDAELVLVDSPGFEGVKRNGALAHFLKRHLRAAGTEIDCATLVLDGEQCVRAGYALRETFALFDELALTPPSVIVLNKCDRLSHEEVPALIAKIAADLSEIGRPEIDIIPVSAKTGRGIPALEELLVSKLPLGARMYPEGAVNLQSEEFLISEIIREKVFSFLGQELPYVTAVTIEGTKEEGEIFHIHGAICVERDSQKGIVIGRGGEMLKRIGSAARKDLEQLFGIRVYLELFVRVENDWTKSDSGLRRVGYGE